MKIIVYSVNIGGYDYFNHPNVYDPDVRYILFTDNKYFTSKIWEVCHTDFIDNKFSNRKKARFIKLNPHLVLPPHDVSIWIDHCFKPRFNDASSFLDSISFENKNIMCFKHSERNCTYDESEVVKEKKLDDIKIIDSQMERYRKEGFPEKFGLFETGILVRRNCEDTIKLDEKWWSELKYNSQRDQLSQMYSSWKTKIQIDPITIDKSQYSNRWVEPKIKHIKKIVY